MDLPLATPMRVLLRTSGEDKVPPEGGSGEEAKLLPWFISENWRKWMGFPPADPPAAWVQVLYIHVPSTHWGEAYSDWVNKAVLKEPYDYRCYSSVCPTSEPAALRPVLPTMLFVEEFLKTYGTESVRDFDNSIINTGLPPPTQKTFSTWWLHNPSKSPS